MDTQKFTAEYRLMKWTQIIKERQSSGQSVKDFCQGTGVSRNAYYYWLRKVRETACTELSSQAESKDIMPNGWIQLAKESPYVEPALDIEVSGCHIKVNKETDPELIKKVCRVLRSL